MAAFLRKTKIINAYITYAYVINLKMLTMLNFVKKYCTIVLLYILLFFYFYIIYFNCLEKRNIGEKLAHVYINETNSLESI